jgi:thioredoxin reductase (NADPH)
VITHDCLIVGGGPAGLSAAIYLARLNRSVVVADDGSGRSTTHETNENYLGFPDGIKSKELRRLGRLQAERFGAEFATVCVRSFEHTPEGFTTAELPGMTARTVILATGVNDNFPEFEGCQDYVGKSIFWCIICDGHKASGKRVIVAGEKDEAAVTAMQMLNFTERITFVTNASAGESELTEGGIERLRTAHVPLHEGRIEHVEGESGMMTAVVLDSGDWIEAEMLFSIQPADPKNELARQLGVKVSASGYLEVDHEQRTNVPHVYAAGDLTRPFGHQIVSAAHEGATAAQTANYDLYRPEQRED